MQISSLLLALSDGEFHSGSDLGRRLGVSRTAIWKALDHLSDFGLEYESYRGKGYRLLAPLDLLSIADISAASSSVISGVADFQTSLSCESTNQSVRELSGDSPYQVFISEQQTAGRGRRGKNWVSPFAQNIYMSVCFDWYAGAAALQGLSIVAGVVVAELLVAKGVSEVGLKWPNDIWLGSDKVSGILVELEGEATSKWRVTLGVGLNVQMSVKCGMDIGQSWANVGDHLRCSRSVLAAHMIDALCDGLEEFKLRGFDAFVDRYAALDVLRGREVKLLGPEVEGVVVGVDQQGGLLLDVSGVEQVFHAGELSVRAK